MKREAKVTVEDLETGDVDEFYLTDGLDSFLVLCGTSLEVTHASYYGNGTKVVTIKKVKADEDGS